MWYVLAKQSAQNARLDQVIKPLIRQSAFFRKMFQHYGVDPRELWKARFSFGKAGNPSAEQHDDEVVLDVHLVQRPLEGLLGSSAGSMDLLRAVTPKLSQWLSRTQEQTYYSSDRKPVSGLEWAIAFDMSQNRDIDSIVASYNAAFESLAGPAEAKRMLLRAISTAKHL